MKKIHGKPFDYFKLGKSFQTGKSFMEHMKSSAASLAAVAVEKGGLITVSVCPVCGNSDLCSVLKVYEFDHYQCNNPDCRHVFVGKYADEKTRSEFFESDGAYSEKNYCNPEISDFRIKQIAVPKTDFALQYSAKNADSWLDVGCGAGEILHVMKGKGWNVTGLELSHADIRFAREKYGLDIHKQTLAEFVSENPEARFDVISFFGVLHCVPGPAALLEQARGILKPGGIVVSELTHHDSLEFDAVKAFPGNPSRSAYNGATTLHHFTAKSAEMLFEKCGYSQEAVWYYGADFYEILNQLCFISEIFAESDLYRELLKHANEFQYIIDKSERSSGMVWIARKPSGNKS